MQRALPPKKFGKLKFVCNTRLDLEGLTSRVCTTDDGERDTFGRGEKAILVPTL